MHLAEEAAGDSGFRHREERYQSVDGVVDAKPLYLKGGHQSPSERTEITAATYQQIHLT
jgi:hypothetical protein